MQYIIYSFMLIFAFLFSGCGADAGIDKRVKSGDSVTLDASRSDTNHGGKIVRYEWKQKKPDLPQIAFDKNTTKTVTFTAPNVTEKTTFYFELHTIEHYDCSYSKKRKGKVCKSDVSISKMTVTVSPRSTSDRNTTFTISGKITDTHHKIIKGASIHVGDKTTKTNNLGLYSLKVNKSSDKLVINVSHPDYFKNSRILNSLKKNTPLNIQIEKPIKKTTFSSLLGKTLIQSATQKHGIASIQFPKGGYIDAQGKEFNGTITAKMSYYPFSTNEGKALIPGITIDGNSTATIKSYGFMLMELVDNNNSTLKLASNHPATLTFPIDTDLDISSLPRISLSYYDNSTGAWKESKNTYAQFTEQNNTRPTIYAYVGKVTQIIPWSLDLLATDTFSKSSSPNSINSKDTNTTSNTTKSNNGSNINLPPPTGTVNNTENDRNNTNKETNTTTESNTTKINTNTKFTLSGTVTDTRKNAILGALISIGGEQVTTDRNGSYTIESKATIKEQVLTVQHRNYFLNSKILSNITKNRKVARIELEKTFNIRSFSALVGTTLTYGNAKIKLPANAYKTSKGKTYTSRVIAYMSYHPFTSNKTKTLLPGMQEGDVKSLTTDGFISLKVTDTKHNPLTLTKGHVATLIFPVDNKTSSTPEKMPLSYYDEKTGKWIKNAEATLIQEEESYYQGSVKQIHMWGLNVHNTK